MPFDLSIENDKKGPKNDCWDACLSDCLLTVRKRCESTQEGWRPNFYEKNNNVGFSGFISSGAP